MGVGLGKSVESACHLLLDCLLVCFAQELRHDPNRNHPWCAETVSVFQFSSHANDRCSTVFISARSSRGLPRVRSSAFKCMPNASIQIVSLLSRASEVNILAAHAWRECSDRMIELESDLRVRN